MEVDGVNYTKENLSQIFSIGKQVAEYQKEHPGYDPILIHKDYTKKTQELSDLRRQAPVVSPEPVSGQKKAQEKPDISKFRKEDVEYFEQLASALGYAKGEDIEQREKQSWQRSYETVKREEIVKFLDAHPEYKPENDSQDLRWNAVKAEFYLYKLPEDPRNFGKLLDRAHRAVTGTSLSADSKKIVEILAKKKAASAAQASSGGGGTGGEKASGVKSKRMERLSQLAKQGALSGYSEKELEEMFS